jgi:hypothetical protein
MDGCRPTEASAGISYVETQKHETKTVKMFTVCADVGTHISNGARVTRLRNGIQDITGNQKPSGKSYINRNKRP